MLYNMFKGCTHGTVFFNATDTGGEAAGQEKETDKGAGEEKQSDADPAADDNSNKYTEADLSAIKAQLAAESQDAITKAVNEALEKAKLSPEELAAREENEKTAALTKREQEVLFRELKADTLVKLEAEKLPKEVVDLVLGSDGEATDKKIKAFKTIFDNAVKEQVIKQLAGKTPPAGNASGSEGGNNIADDFRKGFGC